MKNILLAILMIPHLVFGFTKSSIEGKGGYFIFADSTMREIYKSGGWDVQMSGTYPVWRWLQIYGSLEFMMRSGKTLGSQATTSLWELPISLGLQPSIKICNWAQAYFTLGPRYVFVHQHIDASYYDRKANPSAFGGFVNAGFHFYPLCHMVIDFFGEYSYVKVHYHPSKPNVFGKSIQVGGFAFGGGLGYAF